jgi:hypothetical protein
VLLDFKGKLLQVLAANLESGRHVASGSTAEPLSFTHGIHALRENPQMLAGRAVCFESALIDHALDCGRGDSKDGGGLTHAV